MDVSRQMPREAGLELADNRRVRLSQAIGRILRAVGQRLSPARTEVLKVIEWTGNTSPVSIPIVFDHGLAEGRLRAGNLVRMAAIGKGAISGACPVEWGA